MNWPSQVAVISLLNGLLEFICIQSIFSMLAVNKQPLQLAAIITYALASLTIFNFITICLAAKSRILNQLN
jgi:hypothetical protein